MLSSTTVNPTLRQPNRRPVLWPRALAATRLRTTADKLCTAYCRRAAGADLLTDRMITTGEHMLVVVESGALMLECAQRPVAVHEGGSVLVPSGKFCITEAPMPGCEVAYWIIFFGPPLLREAVGDSHAAEQFALRVAPVLTGAYVQRNTRMTLLAHRLATPVTDVKKTFMALMMSMSSSFFMFLGDHYFRPRAFLQDLARLGCVGTAPGGTKAFHKSFRLYHGVNPSAWLKQQKSKGKVRQRQLSPTTQA
jgi:hypothetical protein